MTLLMIVVRFACFFLLLDCCCIPGIDLVSAKQHAGANTILQARCEAVCHNNTNRCIEACLISLKDNPGECPQKAQGLEAACINECSYDTQCSDIQKCCTHSCGVTCQYPVGLFHYYGLPNVPKNLTVREIRKNKSAQLTWKTSEENERIIYVLQRSSHPGRYFNLSNLGQWTTRHLRKRNSTVVKDLHPGNWYVFRVASVNENGTKGFSPPSAPFTLSEEPKPPKAPTNIRVVNTGMVNGLLWAELLWDVPQSDLPIQRYKVYWSLRLLPGPPPSPLIVRHKNVLHGKTGFILKKLKPDAEYFLQVEAYSQFGKERLKGEKGSLPFNTTNYKNESVGEHYGRLVIKKLWIKRVNDEIKARIVWSGSKYTVGSVTKYIVIWKSLPTCTAEKTKMAATTYHTNYDLFGLQPGCKYSVNVKEIGLGYTRSKEILISTPV